MSDTEGDNSETIDYGENPTSCPLTYHSYNCGSHGYNCDYSNSMSNYRPHSSGFFSTLIYALFSFLGSLLWFGMKLMLGYLLVNTVLYHLKMAVNYHYIVPTYGSAHLLSNCVFVQERSSFESVLFYLFCY
jgi:hypothetical protein